MIQLGKDARVIRPVHETAQDYFERQGEDFSEAHPEIAAACLIYFLSGKFYQIPTHVRRVDLVNSQGAVLYRARAWSFLSQSPFAGMLTHTPLLMYDGLQYLDYETYF